GRAWRQVVAERPDDGAGGVGRLGRQPGDLLGSAPLVEPGRERVPAEAQEVGGAKRPPVAVTVDPGERDSGVLRSQLGERALLWRERSGPSEEIEPAEIVVGHGDRQFDRHSEPEPTPDRTTLFASTGVADSRALKLSRDRSRCGPDDSRHARLLAANPHKNKVGAGSDGGRFRDLLPRVLRRSAPG